MPKDGKSMFIYVHSTNHPPFRFENLLTNREAPPMENAPKSQLCSLRSANFNTYIHRTVVVVKTTFVANEKKTHWSKNEYIRNNIIKTSFHVQFSNRFTLLARSPV